jgi:GT2 family glycosyltransferase
LLTFVGIAVVVLTHDRVDLLRQCVENVLLRTSGETEEIIIWDNASTDGTPEYLGALTDPRIRVVAHPENIGQNAYAEAFALTSSSHLIEVDDDVVWAPAEWDRTLLDAFVKLPDVGFLAADLEDDPRDTASHIRHHVRPHEYRELEENGVPLLAGPTGGGCAMTSRAVHDLVGGFPQQKGRSFYLEDAAYIERIKRHGYRALVLRDLRVHHTGGDYYTKTTPAKAAYWQREKRAEARKDAIKRMLLRLPFVRASNRRYGWFHEPA